MDSTALYRDQLLDRRQKLETAVATMGRLDEVSRLPAEYPGWMFERQGEVRLKQLLEAHVS